MLEDTDSLDMVSYFSDLEDGKIACFADVESSFSEMPTAHYDDYSVTD